MLSTASSTCKHLAEAKCYDWLSAMNSKRIFISLEDLASLPYTYGTLLIYLFSLFLHGDSELSSPPARRVLEELRAS